MCLYYNIESPLFIQRDELLGFKLVFRSATSGDLVSNHLYFKFKARPTLDGILIEADQTPQTVVFNTENLNSNVPDVKAIVTLGIHFWTTEPEQLKSNLKSNSFYPHPGESLIIPVLCHTDDLQMIDPSGDAVAKKLTIPSPKRLRPFGVVVPQYGDLYRILYEHYFDDVAGTGMR